MAIVELVSALVLISCLQVTQLGGTELAYSQIMWSILRDAPHPNIIPILEDGEAVKVTVGLDLMQLLEVNKESNELEVLVWQTMTWRNPALSWDPRNTSLRTVNLPTSSVWMPDLTVYNSVKRPEVTSPELVVVSPDGSILYVPSLRLRFSCDLRNVDSPSGTNCTIKLGSWTYSSMLLSLGDIDSSGGFTLMNYTPHAKYSVLQTSAEKEVLHYACCPESYEDYRFTMTIKEDTGIFPSLF